MAVANVNAGLLLLAGRVSDAWGHLLATAAVFWSFAIAACLFGQQLMSAPEERAVSAAAYTWFSVGTWDFRVGLLVDQLSILFALLITGVGGLIHIFSIGYMHGDARPVRYFAYLNLFIVAMLFLVMGDNMLLLFLGWEGVGLCSYLLIGFWYADRWNAYCGAKAFVVNRIGDFGFLVAMFLMFANFGSLSYAGVGAAASEVAFGGALVTAICLFLFLGATGKSAQLPLFVWLPDAMAGPTPVSALIHAATMVTAGVYMIARSFVLWDLSPTAQGITVAIGILTALVAAVIAIGQFNIKKVLAYSTVSQLGLMFVGLGAGAASGGKDAAIVLADCDLERTAAGLTNWALHNAGQNCGK